MKRIVLLFVIVLIPVLLTAGNGERKAWRQLKKETHAICLFIPKPPIALIQIGMKKNENKKAAELLRHTRNIKVLVKEDVSKNIYNSALSDFRASLKQEGYEPVLTIIEEGSSIACYVEVKDDIIRKAYILLNDGEDLMCIRIKGRFTDRHLLYLASDLEPL